MSNLGPIGWAWPFNEGGKLIGWNASGTALKNYSALMSEYTMMVNPMEPRFGAVGDGVTNDDDAVQAALDYLDDHGGGVLALTHLHFGTATKTYTSSNPIMVQGTNPFTCGFVHQGNNDCLKIEVIDKDDMSPIISRVGFIKKTGASQNCKALHLRYDAGWLGDDDSGSMKGPVIEGCYFRTHLDAVSTDVYWGICIYLHQMGHSFIVNNWINGQGGLTTNKVGYGIALGHFAQGTKILGNVIRGFANGVGTYEDEFFELSVDLATARSVNGQSARANSTAYQEGDRIYVSTNNKFIFRCTTAGTSAGSVPAGYATAGQDDLVTDGTAVFEARGYQNEGINISMNTFTACERGVSIDLRTNETAWNINNNQIDVDDYGVYIRNMSSVLIVGNSLGNNGGQSPNHRDIYIVSDDGAASPAIDDENVATFIYNNRSFRLGDLDLIITGVTRGATTVVAYTADTDSVAPTVARMNAATIFIKNINGTTELEKKAFRCANATYDSGTRSGTVELRDYYTSAAINSSGYGAWTSGGRIELHTAFLEVRSGAQIKAYHNHVIQRSAAYHLGPEASYVDIIYDRTLATDTKLINDSLYPKTLTLRDINNTLQIRQSATRTFTSNTSAQAIFNEVAAGAFTLEVGDVVDIDLLVSLTNLSSSSSDFSFGLAGTATLADICLSVTAMKNTAANAARHSLLTSATATVVVNATTGTEGFLRVVGSFRVTVAGTVIPQLTQNTASSAAVVGIGSYCKLTKQPPVRTYGEVS